MLDMRDITNHPDRNLHALHNHFGRALVLRDVECRVGFGRKLLRGEEVQIQGTTYEGGYNVAVPEECGFYDYTAFEVMK